MIRRALVLAAAALATTAVPAAAAAAAPPSAPASAPIQARLGAAACQDMSAMQAVPLIGQHLAHLPAVPTVRYEIRGTAALDRPTPYEVTVDGQVRGTGMVGKNGFISAQLTVPADRTTTVRVRAAGTVHAERTYAPLRC
ncbi:hypothetical protein [Saccharopolyspora cebuensis]|uniref:Uncharacterized protein n=1 Tax=Saccharopolyspora cebuensis TaxID=418759 RepID=A0ABV4CNS9_9PSEU